MKKILTKKTIERAKAWLKTGIESGLLSVACSTISLLLGVAISMQSWSVMLLELAFGLLACAFLLGMKVNVPQCMTRNVRELVRK